MEEQHGRLLQDVEDSLDLTGTVGNARVSFFVLSRTLRPGEPAPHCHADYEILYTVSGEGVERIGKESYPFKEGDIFLIRPRENHWCEKSGETPAKRYSFRFSLDMKSSSRSEEKACESLRRHMEGVRLIHDTDGKLGDCLLTLEGELLQRETGYISCLRALCVRAFVLLLRLTGVADDEIFTAEKLRYGNYWRAKIEQFVDGKYMNRTSVKDLAEQLHLSVRQTSRLLNKEMGKSFVQVVNDTRIDRAKLLMEKEDMLLSDVAAACGFQSYSYFVSCFTKREGCTPLVYSKRQSILRKTKEKKGESYGTLDV